MSLRNPADRTRAATVLLGEAGVSLLPMFEQGAEGIRKARAEAERFGLAFTAETVKALQEGDDALKKLTAAWDGFIANVAVGTVALAEAVEILEKDQLGELEDTLASINADLRDATLMPEGGAVDAERVNKLLKEREITLQQIANLESNYTRGGGSRRGRAEPSAPGFEKADEPLADSVKDAREQVEQYRQLVDETDRATQEWLWSTTDVEQALLD